MGNGILFDVQEASTCLFFLRISTQLNTRDIIAVGFHVCSEMRECVWVCKLTLSQAGINILHSLTHGHPRHPITHTAAQQGQVL